MKLIFKIVVLFILAVVVAGFSSYGPGHVILFIGKYRLDLSLATLMLIILIAYVALYYMFILGNSIYSIPKGIRLYRHKTAINKSRKYFNLAVTNYYQNEYQTAYDNALKSISYNVPASDKFPVLLLALDLIDLMNDSEDISLIKLNKLVAKLVTNKERVYAYNELTKINKTRNNRLYLETLAKLK